MLEQHLLGALTQSSPSTRPHRIIERVVRSIVAVPRWLELHCQREQLAELEDHQLTDLGLSRAQVRKECAKWPWQI
jgi:uncharacterized protein YjiS (DUF1127 family)